MPDYFPDPANRYLAGDLNDLLNYCVNREASDIKLYSDWPVMIKCHGKNFHATSRPLSAAEISDFAVQLYGAENALTILAKGSDIDVPYDVRIDRNTRLRFRVSITGMQLGRGGFGGIRITLRSLPSAPLSIAKMNLPQAILDNLRPSNGMVLITGSTGSGKTTLLASINRYLLEMPDGNIDILTYEDPIEFVYDEIEIDKTSIISQSQVPRDLKSFARGLRNALRNNPDMIMVGEMRDAETLSVGVNAAVTGHLVYSTVHSNNVASTINRITNDRSEVHVVSIPDLIESLRMVISQRLLINPNGGRTAIREYMIFNTSHHQKLFKADLKDIPYMVADMVENEGVSFVRAAKEALDAGTIYEKDYLKILAEQNLGLL